MIREYELQSLDKDPSFLEALVKKDKKYMKNFYIAKTALDTCPRYRNSKQKYNLKLQAIKNKFTDSFLIQFLQRKKIVLGIIVAAVKKYWANDYDRIMEQLDKLLIKKPKKPNSSGQSPHLVRCRCRTKGFGLCFCVDPVSRKYINPPW